jgi:Ca2+-binding EF-hand superfamily protein
VEREKNELAKLKNQMKDLKLEKKKKKKEEEEEEGEEDKENAQQQVAEKTPPAPAPGTVSVSVDNQEVLDAFEKEVSAAGQATEQGSSEGASREVSQEVKEADLVYAEPVRSAASEEVEAGAGSGSVAVEREQQVPVTAPGEVDVKPSVEVEAGVSNKQEVAPVQEKVEEEEEEEEEDDDEEEDDVSLLRMKSLIDGMMTRLEARLTKTESALGDKLHKLDVDRDGVLDTDELKAAVMQMLRRHSSAQDETSSKEAADLIKLLDQDNDGRSMLKHGFYNHNVNA